MSEVRRVHDVSGVPTHAFSHHNLVWWGTVGFIVVEGFTLFLMMASYLYLRLNELDWPPGDTRLPELLIPTINTLLLLVTIVPMAKASHAAHHSDRLAVARWLWLATALSAVSSVLRVFELRGLNVRWDSNAYGSAAWGLLILHTTLLVVDLFETGAFAVLFQLGHAQRKHFPDVSDAADYQYYLSVIYVPIYLILFWGPRLL
ncbi:MAG TPA: hypothetical protein VF167_08355 [Longimicrobiaceae bacterium]